jgi:hypothetical protein
MLGRTRTRVIVGCALLSACYLSHERPGDLQSNTTASAAGAFSQPQRCVAAHVNASRVIPRVILVLDGSCSMSTNYPANGATSSSQCVDNSAGRWAALRNALIDPQHGVVTKLQSLVAFGLVVFGTQPMCPIPIPPVKPALSNLASIEAQLPAIPPGQFTPTGEALNWVYDNLIEAEDPDRPQIVVLATDGEPNTCGVRDGDRDQPGMTNYQPSIDAVTKGTSKHVTTYVISLADSTGSFHDHLRLLANLGTPAGNGALYEPASPEQLAANLEGLLGIAVGCDIALPYAVDSQNACKARVTLGDTALTCDDHDGFVLLDSTHVRLLGNACTRFTAGKIKVDAFFPCAGDLLL